MKTALVCGAGGFIGGHLVKRLKSEGYWVRGVDIKYHEFTRLPADEFLRLDLRREENCRKALALPQGAPTSPRLSNLTNYAMDARLSGQAAACGATYTRYADDLTFSFAADSRQAVRKVIGGTKKIVGDYGYRLHQKRKLVIRRRHQRQMVTGLVVNARPALPRQTRRRLRAIRHHLAAGRAATLTAEQLAGWDALETMILRQRVAPAADGGSGKQTRPDLAR